MKQTIVIEPGADQKTLALDFHGELEPYEARLLGAHDGVLSVMLCITPGFELFNQEGEPFPKSVIDMSVTFSAKERFSLSRFFVYRFFDATNIRMAYILGRKIAHGVENEMILKLPHAPFYGLTQNFDFRVDVPREVLGFEAFRRSILVTRK